MKNIVKVLIVLFSVNCYGQIGQMTCELSADSISMESVIQIRYSVKNMDGRFSTPFFEQFDVVSGPALAQNVSIINGVKSEQHTISFWLRPKMEGQLFIEPFFWEIEDQVYEFPPVEIFVTPNYEELNTRSRLKIIWSSDGVSSASDTISKLKKKKFTKI